jgi:twinkle protein
MRDILSGHGNEFKQQGSELVFRHCPFCGDNNNHFYINPSTDVFYCHKCNAKGNKFQLAKHYGVSSGYSVRSLRETVKPRQEFTRPPANDADKYHEAIKTDAEAMKYLSDRGINACTVDNFKLGLKISNGVQWLSIPYFVSGKLELIKFRSLPPAEKTFMRTKDASSPLFNQDAVKSNSEIVICEGELDAITCWQNGIRNVVSVPNGCSSFTPEWYDLLNEKEKIYLWYDNDEKGEKAAVELSKRFGIEKCYRVRTGDKVKDANEYFSKGGEGDILEMATRYHVENVSLFVDAAWDIFRKKDENQCGINTPWKGLNKLMGHVEVGDLIVVSAPPKTGKTSLCLNIAAHNADQGSPVLFYCLEMRPDRLAKKVIQAECNMSEEEMTFSKVKESLPRIVNLPLYFAYNFKDVNIESISNVIRQTVKRYGIKVVFFDNLHLLSRNISHATQEIGMISRTFKLLAEELEVPIFLIAQPRKLEKDAVMTMNDLKDSSSIGADADQVIILHRKRIKSREGETADAAYEPQTLVRVDASRYTAGGDWILHFEGGHSKFTEVYNHDN